MAARDNYSPQKSTKVATQNLDEFEQEIFNTKVKENYNKTIFTRETTIKGQKQRICMPAEDYWANENIDFDKDEDELYKEIDKRYNILYYNKGYDRIYSAFKEYFTTRYWSRYFVVGNGTTIIRYKVKSPILRGTSFSSCYGPNVKAGRKVHYKVSMELISYKKDISKNDLNPFPKDQKVQIDEKIIKYINSNSRSYEQVKNSYAKRQKEKREWNRESRDRRDTYLADRKEREARERRSNKYSYQSNKLSPNMFSTKKNYVNGNNYNNKKTYTGKMSNSSKRSSNNSYNTSKSKSEVKIAYYTKQKYSYKKNGIYHHCDDKDFLKYSRIQPKYQQECVKKYSSLGMKAYKECRRQSIMKADDAFYPYHQRFKNRKSCN